MSVPDEAIKVRFRSREDFLPAITGDFLTQLRDVGIVKVTEFNPESEHPLAVVVRVHNTEQEERVQEIGFEWITGDLQPEETYERIVVMLGPFGKISFLSLGEEHLGERIELNPEDAEVS
jgi:hypothetical protein